jgi:hypothetical protein
VNRKNIYIYIEKIFNTDREVEKSFIKRMLIFFYYKHDNKRINHNTIKPIERFNTCYYRGPYKYDWYIPELDK